MLALFHVRNIFRQHLFDASSQGSAVSFMATLMYSDNSKNKSQILDYCHRNPVENCKRKICNIKTYLDPLPSIIMLEILTRNILCPYVTMLLLLLWIYRTFAVLKIGRKLFRQNFPKVQWNILSIFELRFFLHNFVMTSSTFLHGHL